MAPLTPSDRQVQTPHEFSLVFHGATVATEWDVGTYDLGISGERIGAIAAPGSLQATREIDASDLIITPGGIDTHTHISWPIGPQDTSCDDFDSASKQAAISGTTTVIDFVPSAAGSLLAGAERRLEEAQASVIDYSFHPIISTFEREHLAEIEGLVRGGMSSFKIYTTGERPDDAEIRRVMEAIAGAGGLPGFHAENRAILADALRDVVRATGGAVRGFPASRPEAAESAMISLVTHFARELQCPVFIYHVSGDRALAAVDAALRLDTVVRAETCTHYLMFDESVYERSDGWKYVITPPLRDRSASAALWRGLREKSLSCVASDHCAYGISHKRSGFQDFRLLPPGAPGLSARMPFLWDLGVSSERLSLPQFVEVTATQPAKTFGLYPRKGVIRVGADADLVAWNPEEAWTWPGRPSSGSDYDIYEGLSGRGLPRLTFVRGQLVAQDGVFVGPSRSGRFIPQRIDLSAWS